MSLGEIVRRAERRLRTHRSRGKIRFDKYADAAMAWTLLNGAYLKLFDLGLDKINAAVDEHRGLAATGAYLAAAAGAYALNMSDNTKQWAIRRKDAVRDLRLREYHRAKRGVIDSAVSTIKRASYAVQEGVLWPLANAPVWAQVPGGPTWVASKIKRLHQRRYSGGARATALSYARTTAQAFALLAAYHAAQLPQAMQNFRSDYDRAARFIEATFRDDKEQLRPVEERLARATRIDEQREAQQLEPAIPAYPVQHNGDPQVTGGIQGRNFGPYLAKLTGIRGRVPATVEVDRNEVLDALWQEKMRKYSANGVIRQAYEERVQEYFRSKPTTMTLEDYIKEADRTVDTLQANIDWRTVQRLKGLDDFELDLLKRVANSLNGNDLVAYGLTELLPGADGDLNKAVLDYMLRNYGREFVELIPALYDGKTSFGFFQFTEYALKDTGGRRNGASIINHALPQHVRVPGSVIYLRGNDHHAAAYLFAVNNLADMINSLNRNERDTLTRIATQPNLGGKKGDIVEFIATAHHQPAYARKAARRWLANGARSDYRLSCTGRLIEYSRKTEGNYAGLIGGGMPDPTRQPTMVQRTIGEPGFDLRGANSDGLHVYRTAVLPGEGLISITRRFDTWDARNGNRYVDLLGNTRFVVQRDGTPVARLHPDQQIYLLAEEK